LKTIIFLFFIFITAQSFAQVSGKSKAGRLFQKKIIPQNKIISAPRISILSPAISKNPITVSNKKIIVKGKIEDNYGIESALINKTYIDILNSGEFFNEVELNKGNNLITIEAINNKSKRTVKSFIIKYEPKVILIPEIVLQEPILNSNREYLTSDQNIILRGIVKNSAEVKHVTINNNSIDLSINGEFQYNLKLKDAKNYVRVSVITKENKKLDLAFNIIRKEITTTPIITIIEPSLPATNILHHDETIISIRGKIEDNYDIIKIEVNSQPAALLGKNEFFANVNLNDGINNIVVSAKDSKGYSAEKLFKIITPVDDKGPEITILSPKVSRGIKIVRKTDVLDVKGKVSDRSGILSVMVNNREVSLLPNKEFSTKLFLGIGNNTIIVKATDNKYNVNIDTFYVTRKLEEVIKTGKYIALLIGINSYTGYWPQLSNAVNDAKELADVLKNQYYFDEVHTLLDKNATRENIINQIEHLVNSSTPDDNILIFYAGHGQFKKSLNKGYWVPVDAKSNSIAGYISNNDIKTFIGGIPSKHTLLITDACFAGDIFRGKKSESINYDPKNMTKYYREVYSKPSRLALTSGSLEQVSDAGKNHHSVFTYYLLKSLKENKRKYLDTSQLFNDFRMAVVNNSDQTPQLQVVRDTNDEGGQFIFIRK